MKRLRAYAGQAPLESGRTLTLTREESHHLCTVLRARRGQDIEVFNAKGEIALARLLVISGRDAVIEVREALAPPAEVLYRVTLCPALVKDAAWREILEKAAELGAAAVVPVWSRYCVPTLPEGDDAAAKQKKWQQTILGAVKQSHRVSVPECAPAVSLDEALKQAASAGGAIFFLFEGGGAEHGDAGGENALLPLSRAVAAEAAAIRAGREAWVFTGPEGGYHPDEARLAREAGAAVCRLGPLILRAETAAIAALAVIHAAMDTF